MIFLSKYISFSVIVFLLLGLFPLISRADNSNQGENRVIVSFLNDPKIANKESTFIKTNGKKIIKRFKHTHSYVANLSAASSEELNRSKGVVVEKDVKVKMNEFQAVNKNWGANRIGASLSNFGGLTGRGVKIGVIDTGIQKDNPQLKVYGGYNFVSNNSFYGDSNGHGTHVAGIISGKPNGNGFSGIAPDAKLYALKVLNNYGEGYASDIIAAIDWAIQNKLDIVNLSLGQQEPLYALENAVNRAYENGLLVVAAAGNEGGSDSVEYPAKYSSVIAVSALTSKNTLASYSSSGKEVEVSAPGEYILSTYMGSQFAYLSGTSMAAPHVAGVLALYKQEYPQYSNIQLRDLLDKSSIDLGPPGRDYSFGYGLVRAPFILPKSKNTVIHFQGERLSGTEIRLIWKSNSDQTFMIKRDGVLIYSGKGKQFIDSHAPVEKGYHYALIGRSNRFMKADGQVVLK